MKKLVKLSLVVLILMMSSCANEALVVPADNATSVASIRPAQEAVAIAQSLLDALNAESRAQKMNTAVERVDVVYGLGSRSANDTLLYAINLVDNGGYVLVSASYATEPVIGYVDSGSFSIAEVTENPEYNYYIEAAKEYVSSAGVVDISPTRPSYTYTKAILPRVLSELGQTYPEGIFCPNKISGCVQTAMMGLLTYIEKPSVLNLTYPERDMSVINIDWVEINKHTKSASASTDAQAQQHLISCLASKDAHLNIARMCREFGYRNNASYGSYSTGAYSAIAKETLTELLPQNEISDTKNFTSDCNLFNELLSGNCVAYVRGTDLSAGGHAWICDGGDAVILVSYAMLNDGTMEKRETPTYYYHFNWGWNGVDNGYFLAGVFDTDKPSPSRYNFSGAPTYFLIYK